MAQPAKPIATRNAAGFRPGAALIAAGLSIVLLLLFWLLTAAHL